jgi:hypothetical protein
MEDKSLIILGCVSEILALIVIVRLWMRRPVKFVSSLFWSVVLLVPFFGLIAYFFLREGSDSHSEDPGDHYAHQSSDGDPGGHSGGHGH